MVIAVFVQVTQGGGGLVTVIVVVPGTGANTVEVTVEEMGEVICV